MTEENIRDLITQLNRLDVDRADYKYIVSIFRRAIKGVKTNISYRSTELYFRARICNELKPSKVRELKSLRLKKLTH